GETVVGVSTPVAFLRDPGAHAQRVVFNQVARNAAELPLGGFSKLTPSAAVLVDLQVPAGHVLRAWADDLQDSYSAFDFADEMARTNDVALPLSPRLYEGFAALDRLRSRCPRKGRDLLEKVAHCHGAALGRVVPGDHFGLAVDAPGSQTARHATRKSPARAREGYADAGLKVRSGREVMDAAEATVIGAELLGHGLLVGASRAGGLALEVDQQRSPRGVFELRGAACNECALSAVLLPLMASDLPAGAFDPAVLLIEYFDVLELCYGEEARLAG
ncbi:unnamed protein product, partial [Prorocentrum cordatum]